MLALVLLIVAFVVLVLGIIRHVRQPKEENQEELSSLQVGREKIITRIDGTRLLILPPATFEIELFDN